MHTCSTFAVDKIEPLRACVHVQSFWGGAACPLSLPAVDTAPVGLALAHARLTPDLPSRVQLSSARRALGTSKAIAQLLASNRFDRQSNESAPRSARKKNSCREPRCPPWSRASCALEGSLGPHRPLPHRRLNQPLHSPTRLVCSNSQANTRSPTPVVVAPRTTAASKPSQERPLPPSPCLALKRVAAAQWSSLHLLTAAHAFVTFHCWALELMNN